MAINALQYLEQGKVEFLYNLNSNDQKFLLELLRKSKNKINIISGFLPKLKRGMPYFCFEAIYDTDEFVGDLFDLVSGRLGYKVGYERLIEDDEKIKNILYNTAWGRGFVLKNLTNIIRANEENINVILGYVFSSFDENMDFIRKLAIYKDLHIRYIFMKYSIERYPDKLNFVYDDIMKYLVDYTYLEYEQLTLIPNLMDKEDISDLAVTILRYTNDIELWSRLKEYILKNYKYNDLAKFLLTSLGTNDLTFEEFKKDADRLFITSNDYKYNIYFSFLEYRKYLSQEVINNFEEYLKYFKRTGILSSFYSDLNNIFNYGLWDNLTEYIDKYLELSKDKDFGYLSSGSTSACYKIGDYVFKLINEKYSQEDVICPNLYLIIKNLEECYIRNANGDVVCGIEVQKYLHKRGTEITLENINHWEESLGELGYYFEDRLLNSVGGDNCAILDSYKDADCNNPEKLPNWFKKTPLVLIDRDLVYKLEKSKKRY